jgi:hypothetical protein
MTITAYINIFKYFLWAESFVVNIDKDSQTNQKQLKYTSIYCTLRIEGDIQENTTVVGTTDPGKR